MKHKKVLITGKGSYIGTNFKCWLDQWPDSYEVDELSVRGDEWKKKSFSKYDVVLHVAGIAHVSTSSDLESLYYRVNRDLAIEVAQKAKSENVPQFIFMSSMIIYGADSRIGESYCIDANTVPNPVDFYGRSKLDADLYIQRLSVEGFQTVIVRTPMVYGPNCKGNFPKLKKIAAFSPIFPNIENQRSIIYIHNLCEFLRACTYHFGSWRTRCKRAWLGTMRRKR